MAMKTRTMSGSNDAWETCVKLTSNDRALLDVLVREARRRCKAAIGGPPSHENWSEAVREVVTAAFGDDRVALLLREKMRSCSSYGTRGRTEGQHMPSTAVGLVGATQTCTVAESLHEDAQRVQETILTRKDQERPLCPLEAVQRSTECHKTPVHARKLCGSGCMPKGGTTPLLPTDSEAQLIPRRDQEHPGELEAGHGGDADHHALADVRLLAGLVGCGVGDDGGGGDGDGDGDGGGVGGGGGGCRKGRGGGGPQGGSGVALADSRIRAPFTINAGNELGQNEEHEAPSQVEGNPFDSVASQLGICGLDGGADPLPHKILTAAGEEAVLGGTEDCLCPPVLPRVGLSPSQRDPAPAVVAAASATTVNSTDIPEDIEDSTLLLGASALPFPPTLATEETIVEEAVGSEAIESVVPRPVKYERQKRRQSLTDVNEASHTPHVEIGTFSPVGDRCARDVQVATGEMDGAHVPFEACPEQSVAGVAAAQPAEKPGQIGRAGGSDGVKAFNIPHASASPLGRIEEEAEVKIAGNAAVASDLDENEAVLWGGAVGGGVTTERKSIPDLPEEEDYAYDFESRKCVRFSDESLWSVHEIRASFERHELADLFYTVGELDRMLEEAEREEQLEASLGQKDEAEADDSWVHLGGGNPAGVGVDVSGSVEDISIESQSFDGEDSDDRF